MISRSFFEGVNASMGQASAILLTCIMLLSMTGRASFFEEETNHEKNTQQHDSQEMLAQDDGIQFYVPSEKDNIISIIDIASNNVIREIKTGARPANVIFMEEFGKAFVTHRNGNSVGVIDLKEQTMIKEIKVGNDPHGLALTQDQKQLYVTTVAVQYVYVIDTVKEEVSRTIDLGKGA
jgi:YVTN family beta-propeller protein